MEDEFPFQLGDVCVGNVNFEGCSYMIRKKRVYTSILFGPKWFKLYKHFAYGVYWGNEWAGYMENTWKQIG